MFKEYKTIKKVALDELVPGKTYISIGIDMQCFPCVCLIEFIERKGDKVIIMSDGLRIAEDADLVDYYEYSRSNYAKAKMEMQDYCRKTYPWRYDFN